MQATARDWSRQTCGGGVQRSFGHRLLRFTAGCADSQGQAPHHACARCSCASKGCRLRAAPCTAGQPNRPAAPHHTLGVHCIPSCAGGGGRGPSCGGEQTCGVRRAGRKRSHAKSARAPRQCQRPCPPAAAGTRRRPAPDVPPLRAGGCGCAGRSAASTFFSSSSLLLASRWRADWPPLLRLSRSAPPCCTSASTRRRSCGRSPCSALLPRSTQSSTQRLEGLMASSSAVLRPSPPAALALAPAASSPSTVAAMRACAARCRAVSPSALGRSTCGHQRTAGGGWDPPRRAQAVGKQKHSGRQLERGGSPGRLRRRGGCRSRHAHFWQRSGAGSCPRCRLHSDLRQRPPARPPPAVRWGTEG